MTVSGEKSDLRRETAGRLSALSPAEIEEKSAIITEKLKQLAEYENARTVFVFIGVRQEPDTRAFIADALEKGKTVAVPLSYENGTMSLRIIKTLSELTPGMYGIPAPPEDTPVLLPENVDLAVIPAVAYDVKCRRLGHGGGYYDRFLGNFRGTAVGIAFNECIYKEIPCEDHDLPVNAVVTDGETYVS